MYSTIDHMICSPEIEVEECTLSTNLKHSPSTKEDLATPVSLEAILSCHPSSASLTFLLAPLPTILLSDAHERGSYIVHTLQEDKNPVWQTTNDGVRKDDLGFLQPGRRPSICSREGTSIRWVGLRIFVIPLAIASCDVFWRSRIRHGSGSIWNIALQFTAGLLSLGKAVSGLWSTEI